MIQEYAIYSVIPPEGCAAILWRDAERKVEATEALRITAPDMLRFGVVDEIVPEPPGGAHTDPDEAARLLDLAITRRAERGRRRTGRDAACNTGTRSSGGMGKLGVDFVVQS